ncbi:MAG: hypothetical protein ACREDE_01165 [Thermoplasmata archaeon]
MNSYWASFGAVGAGTAVRVPFFGGPCRALSFRSPPVASATGLVAGAGFVFLRLDACCYTGVPWAIRRSPAGSAYAPDAGYFAAVANAVSAAFVILGVISSERACSC